MVKNSFEDIYNYQGGGGGGKHLTTFDYELFI